MLGLEHIALSAASLFASEVAKSAGGETGKAGVHRLVALVRGKLSDDEGRAALTLVESKPADEARVRMLSEVLAGRARGDEGFADALAALIAEAGSVGPAVSAVNSGITAGGSISVTGRGKTAGRDLHG